MSDESYASAEIEFVNRSNGTKQVYCYPVTRVVLRERDNPEIGRTFVSDVDGTWVEIGTEPKEVV